MITVSKLTLRLRLDCVPVTDATICDRIEIFQARRRRPRALLLTATRADTRDKSQSSWCAGGETLARPTDQRCSVDVNEC